MSGFQELTQLGVGVATLGILLIVVRYFIAALTKKDEQMIKMVDGFNTTINNHMKHETDAMKELTEAIRAFTKSQRRRKTPVK